MSWDFSVFNQSPLLCAQADADSFYMACNGRQFNSIEEDVCQLVYVERAEVFKSEDVSLVWFFFPSALQKVLTGLSAEFSSKNTLMHHAQLPFPFQWSLEEFVW